MISENHLNREFQASKPNEKWVTDITYLIFNGQRLYLSAIAECFHLRSFRKANEVKLAVRKYMHFYNHQRFQKKLNNLSPYKYRTQVA
ncbi:MULTISPECIES: IS3 family transposase [unclassified Bacillus cereus group]|uniref:IS3 family transposase n=1 Tax=unclassified Bacillus cereus group TaxID=2750818 RepID=UPI0033996A55